MRYYKVLTIADGYHDGPATELSNMEFKELFLAYSSLYKLLPKHNIFSNHLAWFQFCIYEEDGVALYIMEDR